MKRRKMKRWAEDNIVALDAACDLQAMLTNTTIVACACECHASFQCVPTDLIVHMDLIECPFCGSFETMPVLEAFLLASE